MHLETPVSAEAAIAICAILLTACIALFVQRVYLSPLASIPGPKLATATFWYEFYYDVVKKGRYFEEIRKMHQKYGK